MASPDSVFLGRGDVRGPASATDGALAVFDGTTGKLIKVGSASGVYVSSVAGTANQVLVNGGTAAATGAVTLSLSPTLTGIDSLTFSGGQSLVGTTANVTELRNTSSAQALNVYKTTDGTNKEYLSIFADANGYHLRGAAAGTGSTRGIYIGPDGNDRWQFTTGTHFIAVTDNAQDIGANGANRPRTGYFGTSVVVGTSAVTLTSGGNVAATGNVNAGGTGYIYFNGRSNLKSPADAEITMNNAAETFGLNWQFTASGKAALRTLNGGSGVLFDVATADNVLAVRSRGDLDTATIKANKAQITGLGAFAAGDKYVIVDASGNFHVSALGPAS